MGQRVFQIELPLAEYERFCDLQRKILSYEIEPEMARYEAIEILSPFWDHMPEAGEYTEIVLKPTVSNISPIIAI